MRIIKYLALLYVVFIANSCSLKEKEVKTADELTCVFSSMEVDDVVDYYINNQGKFVFLDSIFVETITPVFYSMPIDDVKDWNSKLKGTTISEYVDYVYDQMKDEYLSNVEEELDSIAQVEKDLFDEQVLPMIEMGVDSMLTSDVDYVMSKYAGGFLNFRKLAFFAGRDANDFEELWNDTIKSSNYARYTDRFIADYMLEIKQLNTDYIESLEGVTIWSKIKKWFTTWVQKEYVCNSGIMPNLKLNTITKEAINNYTDKETSEMFTDGLKDYAVPGILGAFSFGTLAGVYEVCNIAYDVNEIVTNDQPSPDDVIKDRCVYDMIEELKIDYLEEIRDYVHRRIDTETQNTIESVAKKY